MPELDILECTECGLIFFSSFLHIHDAFYQQSGMHDNELDLAHWQRDTKHDDVHRFHILKPLLTNRSLLDFGCGTSGFFKKVQKLANRVTASIHHAPQEVGRLEIFNTHIQYDW